MNALVTVRSCNAVYLIQQRNCIFASERSCLTCERAVNMVLGVAMRERLSKCAVVLVLAVFLIGLPLFSALVALSGISNTPSPFAASPLDMYTAFFWTVCLLSLVVNACAVVFNSCILMLNITEKPGDATGDFTVFFAIPLTICLTPIFVISVACYCISPIPS